MNSYSVIESELLKGNIVMSYTYGDSMEPLLYNLSTCVIINPITEPLKNGDLPLYKRPSGQLVMHRIIKQDKDNYYTRGDNRTGFEKVPKEWTLGVVTEIIRKGKTIKSTDIGYRFYSVFWKVIYPVRLCFMKVKRLII